jgi:hypothetical protein
VARRRSEAGQIWTEIVDLDVLELATLKGLFADLDGLPEALEPTRPRPEGAVSRDRA